MYEAVVSELSVNTKLWTESMPRLVWLRVSVAEVTVAVGATAYTGIDAETAAAEVSVMMEMDP